MHTNTHKRPLSRTDIRRRIAGIPVTAAMIAQMLKTIHRLQQENQCLRSKLGC
jgi:hypothetical protein